MCIMMTLLFGTEKVLESRINWGSDCQPCKDFVIIWGCASLRLFGGALAICCLKVVFHCCYLEIMLSLLLFGGYAILLLFAGYAVLLSFAGVLACCYLEVTTHNGQQWASTLLSLDKSVGKSFANSPLPPACVYLCICAYLYCIVFVSSEPASTWQKCW